MSDERLNDIEIKLMHQDRQIADLNDVVLSQGREIEVLKAKLKRAEDRLADVSQAAHEGEKPLSATESARRDKPPHY